MPGDARHGEDVANEPEAVGVLKPDVQGIQAVLQEKEHRRVRIDVMGQDHRHPAAKRRDNEEVERESDAEQDGARDLAVEPDDQQEHNRADDIQGPGDVDRELRVHGTQQRDRDLGSKRRDQELGPVDTNVAEPPDVPTQEHGDDQRQRDDREEEKH